MGSARVGARKLAIVYWILASSAFSADKPITIREAVQISREKSLVIAQAREKVNQIDSEIPAVFSNILPDVNAQGNMSYRKDSLLLNNALFGGDPYNSYDLRVQIIQPIFVGGAVWAGYQALKKEREIQQMSLKIAERDVTVAALKKFYLVLLNERRTQILRDTRELQKEFLGVAERKKKSGLEQELNWLQARTQVALLEPKITTAEKELKIAAEDFALLLKLENINSLRLEGSLKPPNWAEVQAQGSSRAQTILELESQAITGKQLDDTRKIKLSKHLPRLDIVAYLQTAATQKTRLLDEAGQSWQLGLRLTVPLFSGLSSVFERSSLSSQKLQHDLYQGHLRDSFSLQQREALETLEASRTVLSSYEFALEVAKQTYDAALKRYRNGLCTYQQFVEIQKDLLDAQLSLNQSSYDYIVNMVKVFVAYGWPLDVLVQSF